MKLFLSRAHYPITTLGPGSRVGVWFQGCSIQCEGCISADTWARGRGETTVARLMDTIAPWLSAADGITISGGEPFDQPDALEALTRSMRNHTPADILVFSGYAFETLQPQLRPMEGLIDALVTDPYDINAPQTLALRGSDNQRLHCLTPLGRQKFKTYDRLSGQSEMSLDVMFDDDGTAWLAGIPRRNDMQKLTTILNQQGHSAQTTQAPSRLMQKRTAQ